MDFLRVILSAVFSAVSLFIIAKLIGHKQMGQLNFFDYITGITIGSIAAEMATELEAPWKPLVAMLVYGGASVGLSLFISKVPKSRKYINGTPTIIMKDGKLFRKNMEKAKLDLSEFMIMCRQEGYFSLGDINTAVFECNGRLTILPKAEKRPLEPEDIGLAVKPSGIATEVIMDGEIMDENLKRLGFNYDKLKKEISAAGYKDEKEIFLGIYECDGSFRFYSLD